MAKMADVVQKAVGPPPGEKRPGQQRQQGGASLADFLRMGVAGLGQALSPRQSTTPTELAFQGFQRMRVAQDEARRRRMQRQASMQQLLSGVTFNRGYAPGLSGFPAPPPTTGMGSTLGDVGYHAGLLPPETEPVEFEPAPSPSDEPLPQGGSRNVMGVDPLASLMSYYQSLGGLEQPPQDWWSSGGGGSRGGGGGAAQGSPDWWLDLLSWLYPT